MLLIKHERIKLVTFRTEESMEESKKSCDYRRRGRREAGDEARTLSSKWLELGEEEGVYRRGPLVPVRDRNQDERSLSSPGRSLQPGVDFYSRLEVPIGSKS